MSDEKIIEAFHLMWGNFPEAVVITQKSREIVAVNKTAEKFGLKTGIKCSSVGSRKITEVANAIKPLIPAKLSVALTKEILARRTDFGFRFPKSPNGLFILALGTRLNIRKFLMEKFREEIL